MACQRLPNAVDLCICTHISIIYVKRTLVCRIMFLTWLELWMGSAISKVSWSGLDILNWKKNIAIFCHRMKGSGHMNFIIMNSNNNGQDCIAVKPVTGRKYDCVISKDNYWIGFPHLYYPSNPHFAENFVKKAQEYRKNKNGKLI